MNVLRYSRSWQGLGIRALSPACRPRANIPRFETPRLPLRSFRHLASNSEKDSQKPIPASQTAAKSTAKSDPPRPATLSADETHISISQQRKNDWRIVKQLSGNLWPKDDWSTRARVVVGMGLLVAGKVSFIFPETSLVLKLGQVLNVQVPLLFKNIIDSLNIPITDDSTVWVVAGSLILGCMCLVMSICHKPHRTCSRRGCENRSHTLRGTSQRGLCKRRATGHSKSCAGDV